MPNQEEQPHPVDAKPIETDGIGSDNTLEKTQFFTDDSTPSSAGSNSGSASESDKSGSKKRQKFVGGYRLIKMLGEGGMGRVFQASDESGRMVAIKLLSPELSRSPEALERFKLEGIIASAISHPHCVFVHRADEDCGTPFIAMELMTGQTLKDIVAKRGPLPYTEAIPLVLQCIDGLIEAHSRGMIHRDVKPANCYLDDQGNVKIGDFGLARSLVSDSELTRTGSFLGTPLYASPEQILGEKVDEQSDIYSLAATIYFLLAGKAPFESPHATQVIAKIVSADPPPFSEAGVQVPKKLEQVVLRGLARDRSKRFTNFQEFRDDLIQALGQRERVATLPRRALAYVVDSFLISISIDAAVLSWFAFGGSPIELENFANILGTLWLGLYLLTSEALFGTTIGKRLLNLRVVNPDHGNRPRFLNCLIRTTVFLATVNVVEIIASFALNSRGISPVTAPVLYSLFSWIGFVAGSFAILSVWKRSEKKQLLHEWFSQTQTWVTAQKSVTNTIEISEPRWSIPTQPVELSRAIPSRFGRFDIVSQIATEDRSTWFMAHDSTIERAVWIQLSEAICPPPTESREKCVRRTRMRFLETGIQDSWRWDAYVAPDGAPIALWFDHRSPMPWPVTRHVIKEALDEVNSTDNDRNAASIEIARWWLTSTGKLTLSEAPVKTSASFGKVPSDSKPLFAEIACLAIPDRHRIDPIRNRMERPKLNRSAVTVAPWRATQLLQKIKSGKVAESSLIRSELDRVAQGPQVVNVTMRVVHALILSFASGLPWMTLAVTLMFPVILAIVEEQKDAQSFTTIAAVLREPENHPKLIEQIDDRKRADYLKPERIAAIEKVAEQQYVHFNEAYKNLGFLERTIIEKLNETRGRANFTAKPKPDFSKLEDNAKDNEAVGIDSQDKEISSFPRIKVSAPKENIQFNVGPESIAGIINRFERLEAERNAPVPKKWFNRLRDIVLIPLCVFVVWGGLFRGGLTHAITGLAVVRRDGRRARILQSMWRSLLFWLPFFLIAGVVLVVDAHGTDWVWWTQQLRRCFLALPLLYLIAVIRWPNRGPHDVASGTYVVPI